MRVLALATLCACVLGDPTTININFEGIFQGWNGPSPSPSPSPEPETFLPVPNGSLPLTPNGVSSYDQTPFHVSEVAAGSGVYFYSNTVYNGFFIVEPNGVWVFDVPGVFVYSAIKMVTNNSITHIVYSHTHVDHIGATGALIALATNESRIFSNLTVIGTQWAKDHLQRMNDTRRPVPTMVVGNSTFMIGTHNVSLMELTVTAHLAGSFLVWIPDVQLVMLVDIAFPRWVPFYGLGEAADVGALVPTLNYALTFNFTVFIGGHLGRYGSREDVAQQIEYINSVWDFAVDAQNTVGPATFAQSFSQSNGNPWVALKTWFTSITDACYAQLLPRWSGILGGIDVMGWDHCWVMAEYYRIN